tara:strand:- start:2813 stop:2998 length:186 start_codon:yes stop_codon:yes gene_type:complete
MIYLSPSIEKLRQGGHTGVLDTPEKVQQAADELYDATFDDFRKLDEMRVRAIAESKKIVLD